MKNDLTCGVVRDLLPAYVEGLTSAESGAAVEAHLADCPSCRRLRADLTAEAAASESETLREVDYLKKVKRRTGWRVVLAAVCTVLLLAACLAVKLFIIGTPIRQDGLCWTVGDDAGAMTLRVYSNWSGVAYCRFEVVEDGGAVRVTGRQVLPSFLYPTADYRTRIPLGGVQEVLLEDRLLWQDGLYISRQALALYQARADYVGDAVAVGQVAEALGLGAYGQYTTVLTTSARPYRWTVRFDGGEPLTASDLAALRQKGALAVAVIGNLDEFEFTWTDGDGAARSCVVTETALNDRLPALTAAYNGKNGTAWAVYDGVKDYARSCADLQRLIDLLNG